MYHCSISVSPHTSMYIYVYEEWKAPISSNARVVFTTYLLPKSESFFPPKNASATSSWLCGRMAAKELTQVLLKKKKLSKKKFPLRAHLTCVEGLLMGRLEKVF